MKSLTKLGLAVVLATTVALPATALGQNLLSNPGFEDNGGSFDGWPIVDQVDLSTPADDDIALSGTTAAKIFGKFSGCPFPAFDVSVLGQTLSADPGDIYTFAGSSFVATGDPIPGSDTCNGNRAVAQIVFRDASNGIIARNEILVGDHTTTVDQWNAWSVSHPAPSNAASVEALILFFQPGCDEGAVYLDDLSLTTEAPSSPANSILNASFDDGIATAWTAFGNVFDEARGQFTNTPGSSVAMFSTFVEDSPSGISQSITNVTPGEEYEFGAFVLTTCEEDPIYGGNNNFVLARIEWFDGAGNLIGLPAAQPEEVWLDTNSPLGNWHRQAFTSVAPAGAARADVFILFISPILEGGKVFLDDVFFGAPSATSAPSAPRSFALQQNTPNPFNPKTEIAFSLERDDRVSLRVYDAAGRLIATLADGTRDAGSYTITWDGRNDRGESVASGVYRYVLDTSEGRSSRSMVLLK